MANVLERARTRARAAVKQTQLSFTAPTGETASVMGSASLRHLSDFEGISASTQEAHCSFAEKDLQEEGYPVRSGGEPNLHKHSVEFVDAQGTTRIFTIIDVHPDDTLGIIRCILGAGVVSGG